MASSGSSVFCGGIKALLLALVLSCTCLHSTAQNVKAAESKELPPPRDVKILDEHKDAKGNTIRKIEYRQGNLSITETVIIPSDAIFNVRHPINADTLDKDSVVIIVNKSKYNLEAPSPSKISAWPATAARRRERFAYRARTLTRSTTNSCCSITPPLHL